MRDAAKEDHPGELHIRRVDGGRMGHKIKQVEGAGQGGAMDLRYNGEGHTKYVTLLPLPPHLVLQGVHGGPVGGCVVHHEAKDALQVSGGDLK